jgi:hypothetical protein
MSTFVDVATAGLEPALAAIATTARTVEPRRTPGSKITRS